MRRVKRKKRQTNDKRKELNYGDEIKEDEGAFNFRLRRVKGVKVN